MISTLSIIDMGMVLRSMEPFGFDGMSRRPSIRIERSIRAQAAQVAVGLAAGEAGRTLHVSHFAHALRGGELRHFADRAVERGLTRGRQRSTGRWSRWDCRTGSRAAKFANPSRRWLRCSHPCRASAEAAFGQCRKGRSILPRLRQGSKACRDHRSSVVRAAGAKRAWFHHQGVAFSLCSPSMVIRRPMLRAQSALASVRP